MKKYFFLHSIKGWGTIGCIAMFFGGTVSYLLLTALIYFKYPNAYTAVGLYPIGVGIVLIGVLCIVCYVRTFRQLKITSDKLVVQYKGKVELEILKSQLKSIEASLGNIYVRPMSAVLSGVGRPGVLIKSTNWTVPIIFEFTDGKKATYLISRYELANVNHELLGAGYPQIRVIDFMGRDVSNEISAK